jgi:hypothetical protein
MGINQNLATAALNTALMGIQGRLADVQQGMGAGNTTLRDQLSEQQRANELAEQQLAATRETNQHLTYLISGLMRTGHLPPPPGQHRPAK